MEEKEIFSSNDEFLVSQVEAILKENSIPFIRKDDGAGSYINVAYGSNNTLEKKIIINAEDYDKAKELLDIFKEQEIEADNQETPEELKEEVEVDENTYKKYNRPKKLFGIMIGVILAFFALVIVISSTVAIF